MVEPTSISEQAGREDNAAWANARLEAARYRALGLRRALTEQRLGPPGSAGRAGFVEQCQAELQAVELEVRAVEEVVGANEDITAALQAIAGDRARVQELAGATDPPGVGPDMTWAEAFRQSEVMGYARTLTDEITAQVRPEAEDPVGTLFRSDGPFKAAQNFARTELAAQIEQLMDVATSSASEAGSETMADRFPDFEYRTADPPPGFQSMIQDLLQHLVPALFPLDAGYVTGDLFDMLVSVYAPTNESLGSDLAMATMRVTLVDVLFLRGQLHALASYAASLTRGTVACEALTRTIAILMTAANGSGPGRIPAGYVPALDAVHFYVDAFMRSLLSRLTAAAATAASTGAPRLHPQ